MKNKIDKYGDNYKYYYKINTRTYEVVEKNIIEKLRDKIYNLIFKKNGTNTRKVPNKRY